MTRCPRGFALPFVFGADEVGGDGVGRSSTSVYEKLAEYRVTLPTAMAISGAALAPEMGAMTRRPLRMLMTLANVRLGVWLPNPGRERPPKHSLRRAYFRTPRPYYLFAELFGWSHLTSRYLCVTDGGHYDNLGLVELLRRRCTTLFCIDASGEAIDSFGTIGNALAIARAEALIDNFELDPRRDLAPSPDVPRFVRSGYCIGTVTYPDDSVANIVIVKAGVNRRCPVGRTGVPRAGREVPLRHHARPVLYRTPVRRVPCTRGVLHEMRNGSPEEAGVVRNGGPPPEPAR